VQPILSAIETIADHSRLVFCLVFKDHPDRTFPNLRRILLYSAHDSILSSLGASGNPGAVQAET
jgi:hypothetical protein